MMNQPTLSRQEAEDELYATIDCFVDFLRSLHEPSESKARRDYYWRGAVRKHRYMMQDGFEPEVC